jgi:hypothetical protein
MVAHVVVKNRRGRKNNTLAHLKREGKLQVGNRGRSFQKGLNSGICGDAYAASVVWLEE